jgi:hypothetical protein
MPEIQPVNGLKGDFRRTGVIKGVDDVYMGEYPLKDADMWYDYFNPQ